MSIARISSYGKDRVTTGDADLTITARAAVTTGNRGVVWCHEHGAAAHYPLGYPWFGLEQIALAGAPIVSTDLAGTVTWGNDTAKAAVGNARSFLISQFGANTKVILMAYSMGNLAALNWMRDNPTLVAAYAGFLPATDLADLHDNNRGGYATEIETAYGGAAAYATAVSAHNPAAHRSEYAGIPMKMWYSTDDSLVVPSTVTPWVTDAGVQLSSLGAVGHTTSTSVNADEVFDFVRSYIHP